jgi:6-phosphogluconate dehydrogenase
MTDSSQAPAAEVGVVGLAVMGSNLARNFARHGRAVALYNRTQARTEQLVAAHGDEGTFIPSALVEEFVTSLERPRRREAALRERGLHFVGAGISGGEEGALHGPSIMPGGSRESYAALGPLLEDIAAKYDGEPCCAWMGPDAAGHS